MFKDRCISVTGLRNQTKQCLEGLATESKYVFVKNKPVAALMDVSVYELNFVRPELIELGAGEVDVKLKKEAGRAKKAKKTELVNI
ncbi:MAG: hypothetical protein WCT46_00940 [Candidatus Gracilibacteria bacterium]|jgi:hypothetical protein